MEKTTSNTRISQKKKAKMKAQAIFVDSDNSDTGDAADNTNQVMDSSETMNVTDSLSKEPDKVLHLSLTSTYHIRCLVAGAKHRNDRCKSSKCVSCVRITQLNTSSMLHIHFQIQPLLFQRYVIPIV